MTLLVSHGIKAILLQETLPRYKVDRGVQLSITRLVHYAVMTIGFLVILRIIGFGLGDIGLFLAYTRLGSRLVAGLPEFLPAFSDSATVPKVSRH